MEQAKKAAAAVMMALLIGITSMLAGCAGGTLAPHQEAVAKAATQYATLKFIDGDATKAARVAEVTAFAVSLVNDDTGTTIGALEAAVRAQIDWAELAPEDAVLLNVLISAVRIELEARVQDTDLGQGEVVLQVAEVLSWVNEAVELFHPQSAESIHRLSG